MIFRIDDVSVNTNPVKLNEIIAILKSVPGALVWAAVSPMVHDLSSAPEHDRERAFPRILNAMSDHREFFQVDKIGVPLFWAGSVQVVSHGLVHVDHRLLGREAQEMSIVMSCSALKTDIFVPPFNKYNADTQSVCSEHEIRLVKFEDGWQHVRFNPFAPSRDAMYYLHTHDVSPVWLSEWIESAREAVA